MKGTGYLACLAGVMMVTALVVFWGASTEPMRADEAFYALLADRLLDGGNWLYLQHWWLAGIPYFDKPPLYFWLSAATESLIGYQPLAFRLWSGLFACGAVLCTVIVGRNLFNATTGLMAGLLLAVTSNFLFVLGARDGDLNTAIAFFAATSLAVITGDWPERRPRLAWLCLVLCGGAAGWTKPLNGLILLAGTGAVALCYPAGERRQRLASVAWAAWPAVGFNLLWPVLQWIHYGNPFIARFVGWNLLQRFGSGIDPGQLHPWYFYPAVISRAMALGWLAAGWRYLLRGRRAADAALFLVPLLYLAAISVTPSKLVQYAFPVFPLLAVAAGALIWQAASWLLPIWRAAALGAMGCGLTLLGLHKVHFDLAANPPPRWESAPCLASIDADPGATVLLAGVSALDQVEAEARNRDLEFYLRRMANRLRLVDAPTVHGVVRRHGPALIFLIRSGDSELAAAGLADRLQASSFPSAYGAPVETLVYDIGLDPACASRD